MTKILPVTEAREKLTDIVERANRLLEDYVITVNGKPQAVLMSHDEFESWKETTEIMGDPSLLSAILEGEKDIKKGKLYDWEEVKTELKLDVQNTTHGKSKKRA